MALREGEFLPKGSHFFSDNDLPDAPSGGLWAKFIFDEHIADPKYTAYKKSSLFRELVEIQVPTALLLHWDETANFSKIIWAQRMAVVEYERLIKPKPGSKVEKFVKNVLSATSSYNDPGMFMAVHNCTEESYCAQQPGLRRDEYDAMKAGELSLGDIYERRPAFILRRLLPQKAIGH